MFADDQIKLSRYDSGEHFITNFGESMKTFFYSFFLFILYSGFLLGQGNKEEHSKSEVHQKHPLNHIAVFNGVTTTVKESHNYYTLGFDYVRTFEQGGSLGLGVFGEIIFADHKEYVFGATVYFKLANNFWLRTGPGIEIVKEAKEIELEAYHGDGHQATGISSSVDPHAELEDKTKFLYRVGLVYNFHFGTHWGIAPSIDFDMVEKHNALVYGINIGYAF